METGDLSSHLENLLLLHRDSLESRISELKAGYHRRKGNELEEVMSVWMSIKKLNEGTDFSGEPEMKALMTHFDSTLRFFAGDGIQLKTPSDCLFKEFCLSLLGEVDAVGVGAAGKMTVIDIPTDKLTKESIEHKMDSEDDQIPLLPAEENRIRELAMDSLSNFAFFSVMLCYVVLYFTYSAVVGEEGDTRLMMGLHVWTIMLMLVFFICSCIQFSVHSQKMARLVMAALFCASGFVMFVLLQLTL